MAVCVLFSKGPQIVYWFSCAGVCGRAFLAGTSVLDVALCSAQGRAESKPSMLQVFGECCMGDTSSWDWGIMAWALLHWYMMHAWQARAARRAVLQCVVCQTAWGGVLKD